MFIVTTGCSADHKRPRNRRRFGVAQEEGPHRRLRAERNAEEVRPHREAD